MSDIVIDSCVVAKWVLPEADSKQAMRLFHNTVGRGERLVVLDVALVEAANAVWKKSHRRLISLEEARRYLGELLEMPIQTRAANTLLATAMDIAVKYDCSIYDALFVALANDLRLPGITADEPLVRVVHTDFPNIVLLRDWQ
jgi:predicted nucleic acid-binding protein